MINITLAGTYILEDRSLLWKLNEITNSDAKQEFMSVKFSPPKLAILNTMKYCQLEFELDDTRLSGTLLKAISLKTKNQEIEKNVNYRWVFIHNIFLILYKYFRSYYTLRVGIQLKPWFASVVFSQWSIKLPPDGNPRSFILHFCNVSLLYVVPGDFPWQSHCCIWINFKLVIFFYFVYVQVSTQSFIKFRRFLWSRFCCKFRSHYQIHLFVVVILLKNFWHWFRTWSIGQTGN